MMRLTATKRAQQAKAAKLHAAEAAKLKRVCYGG